MSSSRQTAFYAWLVSIPDPAFPAGDVCLSSHLVLAPSLSSATAFVRAKYSPAPSVALSVTASPWRGVAEI